VKAFEWKYMMETSGGIAARSAVKRSYLLTHGRNEPMRKKKREYKCKRCGDVDTSSFNGYCFDCFLEMPTCKKCGELTFDLHQDKCAACWGKIWEGEIPPEYGPPSMEPDAFQGTPNKTLAEQQQLAKMVEDAHDQVRREKADKEQVQALIDGPWLRTGYCNERKEPNE
jgi:ribosomal protein L37E